MRPRPSTLDDVDGDMTGNLPSLNLNLSGWGCGSGWTERVRSRGAQQGAPGTRGGEVGGGSAAETVAAPEPDGVQNQHHGAMGQDDTQKTEEVENHEDEAAASRAHKRTTGVGRGNSGDDDARDGSAAAGESDVHNSSSIHCQAGRSKGSAQDDEDDGTSGDEADNARLGGGLPNPSRAVLAAGTRLEVWWDGDKVFYACRVAGYDAATGKHALEYDDGDTDEVHLEKEKYNLLTSGSKARNPGMLPSKPGTFAA